MIPLRYHIAVLFTILLMSGYIHNVVAQSEVGQEEDFEGDTTGQNPTSGWYTYSDLYTDTTCNGSTFSATCRSQVVTGGFDGTQKRFKVVDSDGGIAPDPLIRFTLTQPQQFGNMTFYFRNDGSSASPSNAEIFVQLEDGMGNVIDRFHSFSTPNGVGGCVNVNGCMELNGFGPGGGSALIDEVDDWTDTEILRIEFIFDWAEQTFDVYAQRQSDDLIDSLTNISFEDLDAQTFGELQFDDDASWAGMNFDQWQFDGGPIQEVELEPSEFDQGLQDFAIGLGFRTPESQILFSLILIGLSELLMAFLTSFFPDGKYKIWIIHGVASSVGIIVVLIGYLDLWIFLCAFVLSCTITMGAREALNTFRRILFKTPKQNQSKEPVAEDETPQATKEESEESQSQPETEPEPEAELDQDMSEPESNGEQA